MKTIRENVPLKSFTTLDIGGPADFFLEVATLEKLQEALRFAKERNIPVTYVGGGSDILIADEGVRGLVIKVNLRGLEVDGETVKVAAGELLDEVARTTIRAGLGGLETLVGIPGTVGGAIFGNAGAYGRLISDFLLHVVAFDGSSLVTLSRDECKFGYRSSIFTKEKSFAILEATFLLTKAHSEMLETFAKAILAHRAVRVPPQWKYPGSFFKNVDVESIPPEAAATIPGYGFMGKKVVAAFLLGSVGAFGARRGRVRIADHHANLFINDGGATAKELIGLAREFWLKVHEKYGIALEPEVQLLGFAKDPFTLS